MEIWGISFGLCPFQYGGQRASPQHPFVQLDPFKQQQAFCCYGKAKGWGRGSVAKPLVCMQKVPLQPPAASQKDWQKPWRAAARCCANRAESGGQRGLFPGSVSQNLPQNVTCPAPRAPVDGYQQSFPHKIPVEWIQLQPGHQKPMGLRLLLDVS